REAEVGADEVHQQGARLHVDGARLSVDRDVDSHHPSSLIWLTQASRPRRTYASTTARLNSAGPLTSSSGSEARAVARAASANSSGLGACPTNIASASFALML